MPLKTEEGEEKRNLKTEEDIPTKDLRCAAPAREPRALGVGAAPARVPCVLGVGAARARGRGRAAREPRALGAPGRREVAGKKSTTRAAAGAWKGLSLPSLPFSSLPFYSFPAQQARRRETHRGRDSSRACFFVPLRAPVSPLRRPPYASRRRPDA